MKSQLEKAAERLEAENAPGIGAAKNRKTMRWDAKASIYVLTATILDHDNPVHNSEKLIVRRNLFFQRDSDWTLA